MPRKPNGVHTIEIVRDDELKSKEEKATAVFRQFFPDAPALRLYRTADRRIGVQVAISLSPGDRKHFDDAYVAVMKILGEKRGRRRGSRKVQAKLRLNENVYKALKASAERSHKTVSSLVEDLAYQARLVK